MIDGAADEMGAEVAGRVRADPAAADFVISVFSAALQSFRHDSLVRPFPPHFRAEDSTEAGGRDFERLRRCAGSLPPVRRMAEGGLDRDQAALVRWLLRPRGCSVAAVSPRLFESVQRRQHSASTAAHGADPDFLFELRPEPSPAEEAFAALREEHGSMVAYHGTLLENIHSIMRNGFLSHLNTTMLYGPGTYLSSDMAVCQSFTKSGASWEQSDLGRQITCAVVCEVLRHPEVRLPGSKFGGADAASTVGGDTIPRTYVVVPNNDHLRIRYIAVYVDAAADAAASAPAPGRGAAANGVARRLRTFCHAHSFAVTMAVYGLGLLLVGLFNDRRFRRWLASLTK